VAASRWLVLFTSFSLYKIPSNREAVERAFDSAKEFSLFAFLLDPAESPRGTLRQLTSPLMLGILRELPDHIFLSEFVMRFLLGEVAARMEMKPFMRTVWYFLLKRPANMTNPSH
jgi:hypothetical protein